ncbi:MAG: CDP-alcohol phosphatidyltransferase family protein [Pseudomonadota bacterium]|nr:CDP-alcohol phosphatidyltransferase family protein [Pseudomonadota bacterium]
MSTSVYIFHESPVKLWGLTSRERIERVLAKVGIHNFISDPRQATTDTILLLRADYLYDDRVIQNLLETPDTILLIPKAGREIPVAAQVKSGLAAKTYSYLNDGQQDEALQDLKLVTPQTLTPAYQQRLRKFDPPFVLPITEQNRQSLEKHLFSWSYKGITDLVTKWCWPFPARLAVGVCVRRGWKPNQVTLAGLGLVILASILFYTGFYALGLVAGWMMTFFDTVDGKLARVTVTSSKFGHIFDHAIDLIHPPFWYVAWGLGLANSSPVLSPSHLPLILWLIVGTYLTGRLVEAIFTSMLGRFGIFSWHPIDSYFRLITGRRNPNLILLTISTLFGRPDLGLLAVAFWTVVTSLFMLVRLAMAIKTRFTSGPLTPWLSKIDPEEKPKPLAVRLFTRPPTILPDGSRG